MDHSANLLLLGDGRPVCEDCSYNCEICGLKIDDLAIMTANEAYHADCFCCRVCKRKIEDLVFAKTSQGIYCMDCHNERISRSRSRRKEQQYRGGVLESRESLSPSKSSSFNFDLDKGLPSIPPTSAPTLAPTSMSQQISDGSEPEWESEQKQKETLIEEPRYSTISEQHNITQSPWKLDMPSTNISNSYHHTLDQNSSDSHQRNISVQSTPSSISLSEFHVLYEKNALAETFTSPDSKSLSQGFTPVPNTVKRVSSPPLQSRPSNTRSGSMPSSREKNESSSHIRTPSADAPSRQRVASTAPYSTPRSEGYSIPDGAIVYDDTPRSTEFSNHDRFSTHGSKSEDIPPVPNLPTMHPSRHSGPGNQNGNTPNLSANSPNLHNHSAISPHLQQDGKPQPSPSFSLPPKSNRRPVPQPVRDSSAALQDQLHSPDHTKTPLTPNSNFSSSPQIFTASNVPSVRVQVCQTLH